MNDKLLPGHHYDVVERRNFKGHEWQARHPRQVDGAHTEETLAVEHVQGEARASAGESSNVAAISPTLTPSLPSNCGCRWGSLPWPTRLIRKRAIRRPRSPNRAELPYTVGKHPTSGSGDCHRSFA